MSLRSSFILLGLTLMLVNIQSEGALSITKAQEYLFKYGYLPATARYSDNSGLLDEQVWINALKDFQSFFGLNTTGELNKETMDIMLKPRCGVPDKIDFSNNYYAEPYTTFKVKWTILNLTYKIVQYSQNLSREYVDHQIAKAFDVWSQYTDLSFKRINDGLADITIGFFAGEHGDDKPFDGRFKERDTLAHASPPDHYGNVVHFDDEQDWKETDDFFRVAVHEFGHALGLNHSSIMEAVMAPKYHYEGDFILHPDDIAGIQDLYGKKSTPVKKFFH